MRQIRHRVPSLTGLLTVVSFAIVGVVIAGVVPAGLFPRAPAPVMNAIPHALAGVSLLTAVTVVTGIRAIRRGDADRHRRLMVASFALFGLFLTVDFYRLAVVGPTGFAGPAAVETYVYLPLLAIHILLSAVSVPVVVHAVVLGLSHSPSELKQTAHARVGRIAVAAWGLSLFLGIVTYVMLNHIYGWVPRGEEAALLLAIVGPKLRR